MTNGAGCFRLCCGFARPAILLCMCALAILLSSNAHAQNSLSLTEAFSIAKTLRAELRVAAARVDAASQRPAIVSALDDPIIAPSIDHKPVDPMMRTDKSITLEQSFPLSNIRSHKRRAAEADVDKYAAEVSKAGLKIESEVALAFFMLNERRKLREIVEKQLNLTTQMVKIVAARHGAGTATQTDVLRTEIEEARLRSRLALVTAEGRSAETMLNTALGRAPDFPLPALNMHTALEQMTDSASVKASFLEASSYRPELRIVQAEKRRANAEIEVMKSMYAPMAMLRVGVADTMTAGRGYMLMVGVTIPIWRDRLNAGVREAQAMATMADADREAMLRMIQGDVAAGLEAVRGAAANYRAYRDDLLPRVERTLAPALTEYANGRLPLNAVLETNKAVWSVQEESVMAETALGLSWVRLRTALGNFGGYK